MEISSNFTLADCSNIKRNNYCTLSFDSFLSAVLIGSDCMRTIDHSQCHGGSFLRAVIRHWQYYIYKNKRKHKNGTKTIIVLGYRKISLFCQCLAIRYLPLPRMASALHWQIPISILLNLVQLLLKFGLILYLFVYLYCKLKIIGKQLLDWAIHKMHRNHKRFKCEMDNTSKKYMSLATMLEKKSSCILL
jgi:hypothetical protein